uniref:Myb/SANT-like DNA-binding domain-containing protein n=1 Tax=Astyanax mexicanus TaxID=7994 RepID=A0A3B1IEF4_ASTMX
FYGKALMPNFTLEQKLYLLQKIHSVVDAVQDFRKDTNTTVYRNAVWAELAQAFNEAFPNRPPSSVGSLKTLWKRLKVECRVALQRRQEQQASGMPLTALTQVNSTCLTCSSSDIQVHPVCGVY